MYFAMGDIGFDKLEKLMALSHESEKWQFLSRTADEYGYEGIQVSDSYYKKLGLFIDVLPDCIRKFKVTYHVGSLYDLSADEQYSAYKSAIAAAYKSAISNGIEDVSIHPPYLPPERYEYRGASKERFTSVIETFLPKFTDEGITFSVETHVGGKVFLFHKLEEVVLFSSSYPALGILIDISHNFNDGRSVKDTLEIFRETKITGLHISDAIARAEISKGTHLPLGKGEIDFREVLEPFIDSNHIYGALEIKSLSSGIKESLRILKEIVSRKSTWICEINPNLPSR